MPSHSAFSLVGKVALVTGGNGGIGLGMARGLAAAGADIVIAGRQAAKITAAAAELAAFGVKTATVSVDVADDASCRDMIAETEQRMGRIDILINNAGMNIRKQPQDYTPAEWRAVLAVNLASSPFTVRTRPIPR